MVDPATCLLLELNKANQGLKDRSKECLQWVLGAFVLKPPQYSPSGRKMTSDHPFGGQHYFHSHSLMSWLWNYPALVRFKANQIQTMSYEGALLNQPQFDINMDNLKVEIQGKRYVMQAKCFSWPCGGGGKNLDLFQFLHKALNCLVIWANMAIISRDFVNLLC